MAEHRVAVFGSNASATGSHYGLAGFGTAAAYASKLDRKEDETKLKSIVADIYKADVFSTRMAERLEKVATRAG
jgi:hypothetical protein